MPAGTNTKPHIIDIPESVAALDPDTLLDGDLKAAARRMGPDEARFLVDAYYLWQEERKRANNQVRALGESAEPHSILRWLASHAEGLEHRLKGALDAYSDEYVTGRWSKSIRGIGPVIAAGLLAHIDIEKAPTVGHIWRFAGLDPTVKWLGQKGAELLMGEVRDISDAWEDGEQPDPYALSDDEVAQYEELVTQPTGQNELTARQIQALSQLTLRKFPNLLRLARNESGQITAASMTKALSKRPWNAALRTLTWKVGESFVKVSNHDEDVYGHIWRERKELETARNEAGEFADQAAAMLERKKIGKTTEAFKHYSAGHLPPAHIHARAKRYAVKLFLSSWHHVAYEAHYGTPPPKPYVIEHGGHSDFQAPPNWPMQ